LTARKYPADVVRKIMKTYVMPRLARYLSMRQLLLDRRRRQPAGQTPHHPQAGQAAWQINNHVLDPSVFP
ncbi:hypothetical protein, partial [Arthrobacter sp. 9E06]|uniref:hypothetical protein n=1 Tax=Arthrobacter sp. 9E06 TaxID=2058890 RepID=UPI001CA530E8